MPDAYCLLQDATPVLAPVIATFVQICNCLQGLLTESDDTR